VKLIGNLPFSISTVLLLKWLREIPKKAGAFSYGRVPMVLTFQSEVADRLVAQPSTAAYGRLSVMLQYSCKANICFTIKGKSFVPPPKIESKVVFAQPLEKVVDEDVNMDSLEFVLREVFGLRRKQLKNSVLRLGPKAEWLLDYAKINPRLRPEDLTVQEWCNISKAFDKWPDRPKIQLSHLTTEEQKITERKLPITKEEQELRREQKKILSRRATFK